MDRSVFRSAAARAVQPAADWPRASSFTLSGRGIVDRVAARGRPDPLFPAAAPAGVSAYALDRLRSDAAEDRALLAAHDGRGAAPRRRTRGHQAQLDKRDVMVGDRHQAGARYRLTIDCCGTEACASSLPLP